MCGRAELKMYYSNDRLEFIVINGLLGSQSILKYHDLRMNCVCTKNILIYLFGFN